MAAFFECGINVKLVFFLKKTWQQVAMAISTIKKFILSLSYFFFLCLNIHKSSHYIIYINLNVNTYSVEFYT